MTQTQAIQKWQGVIGVKVDGIFGAQTDIATRAWQGAHGLKIDGVVGPNTWNAASVSPTPPTIKATTATKTNSVAQDFTQATKTWQKIIGVPQSGVFDAQTDTATRVWQISHGINPDGVVGENTWKAVGYLGAMPALKLEAIVSAQSLGVAAQVLSEASTNPAQAAETAKQYFAPPPEQQFADTPAATPAASPASTASNLFAQLQSAFSPTPQPPITPTPVTPEQPVTPLLPKWLMITLGGLIVGTAGIMVFGGKKK
jgi:hypothetical protein